MNNIEIINLTNEEIKELNDVKYVIDKAIEIEKLNDLEFNIIIVDNEYIHKLNRELISSLPNKDYGVSIGYSMIMNEQTTIDDAINDALLMINKSKESIK